MSASLKARLKKILFQEDGALIREWGARFPVALVFPEIYPVAMGNLGFQTMYHLFNQSAKLVCERAFLPAPEEWPEYERTRTPVLSLESQRPLRDFAVVAFSLSFEGDYPKVLRILAQSGIPLSAAERRQGDPLVVAGGVAAFLNPEPLAPFMDAFILGEGEVAAVGVMEFLGTASGHRLRREILKEAAQTFPGVYVPLGYQPRFHPDGTLAAFEADSGFPPRVTVPRVPDLTQVATHSHLIAPRSEWGEMFLVELGRGCSRACRFCAAGFLYRPPRTRDSTSLFPKIDQLVNQGRKVGLVGAAVSDHPGIKELCRRVVTGGGTLGVGSLRADSLDPELAGLLAQGGIKSVALAPEAGSARLRRVINKGLSQEALAQAAVALAQAGIPQLRLYFMVGLPTETQEDVREIARLAKYLQHRVIKESRGQRSFRQITLSLASFVPKPFTPFQWTPFLEVRELKQRQKLVRQELAGVKNVRVHTDLPKWAYTQALLSRGDRRVGEILRLAQARGWPSALRESPVNPDFFVYRERRREELFPWDFLDQGLKKEYLWEEYQLALEGKESPPCKPEVCRRCGVCGAKEGEMPNP
uniref:Radical SAM protein n=1 Tax=Desulfobacca acetoxidans TaxID=60893 RepID=A0A7C5ER51_9BACT